MEVAQLSGDVGVPAVTLRADLTRMEDAQLLRRVRCGAVAAHTSRYDASVEAFTAPTLAS